MMIKTMVHWSRVSYARVRAFMEQCVFAQLWYGHQTTCIKAA